MTAMPLSHLLSFPGEPGFVFDAGQGAFTPDPAGINSWDDAFSFAAAPTASGGSSVVGQCLITDVLTQAETGVSDPAGFAALTFSVASPPTGDAGYLSIDGIPQLRGPVTFTGADVQAGHVAYVPGPHGTTVHFTASEPGGSTTASTITFSNAAGYHVATDQTNFNDNLARNDLVDGTGGVDNINGNGGCDILIGEGLNDNLNGGDGNNRLYGGSGDDNMTADSGNDLLDGGSGNDNMSANGGNNILFGGSGNDNMTAGSGNDVMIGGSGNDHITANDGRNYVDAGDGIDSVTVGSDNDRVIMGAGNDQRLDAGGGNDKIQLGGIAGFTSDGNETFDGGTGADDFVLYLNTRDGSRAGWGSDVIENFRLAEGDELIAFDATSGFWDSVANVSRAVGLPGSGSRIEASRGTGNDAADLTLKFNAGTAASMLVLDNFYQTNAGFLTAAERTATPTEAALEQTVGRIIADGFAKDGPGGLQPGSNFVAAMHDYMLLV